MTSLKKLVALSTIKPVAGFSKRPELLLCPNVPKPMHGTAPRVVLGKRWWDKERRAAYAKTEYCCSACGVHKRQAKGHQWMEAHELYEIDYLKGTVRYVEAVALCHYCHCYIHSGRLKAMLDAKKVSQGRYVAVILHGDKVLADAGLKKPKPHDGPTAAWSKWRLVIGRKKYKGLFKNLDEWENYHKEKNDED